MLASCTIGKPASQNWKARRDLSTTRYANIPIAARNVRKSSSAVDIVSSAPGATAIPADVEALKDFFLGLEHDLVRIAARGPRYKTSYNRSSRNA